MIDRTTRDQMAKAIRSYMNEETGAFDFDDAISEAMISTNDKTVEMIGRDLWYCYDDCKDHKIVASKELGDYFNRLLLLLESEAEIETVKTRRTWGFLQSSAAVCLCVFLILSLRAGFDERMTVYAMLFGPVSMFLAYLKSRRRKRTTSALEIALEPFPSVGSLLSVRRMAPDFVKKRYPKRVQGRTIRDPLFEKMMWIPWIMAWCMFSPVPLFFQMLPEKASETRIRMTEPASAGDT